MTAYNSNTYQVLQAALNVWRRANLAACRARLYLLDHRPAPGEEAAYLRLLRTLGAAEQDMPSDELRRLRSEEADSRRPDR